MSSPKTLRHSFVLARLPCLPRPPCSGQLEKKREKKKNPPLHTYVCFLLEVGCHTCLKYNESPSSRHPWIPNTPRRKPASFFPHPPPVSSLIPTCHKSCGSAGLSTKSLTVSEMTGPGTGRGRSCSIRLHVMGI